MLVQTLAVASLVPATYTAELCLQNTLKAVRGGWCTYLMCDWLSFQPHAHVVEWPYKRMLVQSSSQLGAYSDDQLSSGLSVLGKHVPLTGNFRLLKPHICCTT